MSVLWRGSLAFVLPAVVVCAGCTSLLGDFATGGGGTGGDGGFHADATGGGDSSTHPDTGLPPAEAGPDAGEDSPEPTDAPMIEAEAEAAPPPPPPPPPGRPGFDLTSGGNVSTSTHYKLIGAVGEAPGSANIVSVSISYNFRGGVIAGTQSQ
jgi:hypothetical protein